MAKNFGDHLENHMNVTIHTFFRIGLIVTAHLFASGVYANDVIRGPLPGIDAQSKFIVYYGDDYYTNTVDGQNNPLPDTEWVLNTTTLNQLASFDVVVLQPNQPHFRPEVVQYLKDSNNGQQPMVFGYISIGEDFFNLPIEGLMEGDGSGPTVLDVNDQDGDGDRNDLVLSHQGIADFYIDVDTQAISYHPNGTIDQVTTQNRKSPDLKADVNPIFKGYMVNPTSSWRWVINEMRIHDGSENQPPVPERGTKAGLKQIAHSIDPDRLKDRSANFGMDGFFLDTIDTSAPYDSEGHYPWTIDNMKETVKFISNTYPDKKILANRGGFFYTAGLKSSVTDEFPIDYSIRPYVNAFLFESFMYDSGPYPEEGLPEGPAGESENYDTNRLDIAPKVMAEAKRDDGFTVFSLEYLSGRDESHNNVVDLAFEQDVKTWGFVAYMASGRQLDTIDFYFADKIDSLSDSAGPQWQSTGYVEGQTNSVNPRIGVQRVRQIADHGTLADVIVEWDLAIDQSNFDYDLEVTDSDGQTQEYSNISPDQSDLWTRLPRSNSANQFLLANLPKETHSFKLVPRDAQGLTNLQDPGFQFTPGETAISIDANFDDWLGDSPWIVDGEDVDIQGDQMDWQQVWIKHDQTGIHFRLQNQSVVPFNYGLQMFIDADNDRSTGFIGTNGEFGIGADYLIQGSQGAGILIYPFKSASQTSWGWDWLNVDSPAFSWQNGELELKVPRFQLQREPTGPDDTTTTHQYGFPLADSIRLFLDGDNGPFGHANVHDFVPDDANRGGFLEYQHQF